MIYEPKYLRFFQTRFEHVPVAATAQPNGNTVKYFPSESRILPCEEDAILQNAGFSPIRADGKALLS